MKLSEYQLKVAAIKYIMQVYGLGLPEAITHYNYMTHAARDNAAYNYIINESGTACAR